ncbi:hypothetical protein [Rhizobium leguminosarum]|uniref:hypothetical protein n=1 Tax=Rhizobium leguminosarum TaxID=384 RepID=UPI0024B3AD9F|nr:hypothetical protein [Rhizobium leguminosarum]WHO78811.1 hypothetical protein QMO81_001479 [Rhizobium leguminosarum]
MKSYFLEGLRDVAIVRSELSRLLPNGVDPWLLIAADPYPLAYFTVIASEEDAPSIQADLSGRHYDQDGAVLEILRELQKRVGGVVRDDNDNKL